MHAGGKSGVSKKGIAFVRGDGEEPQYFLMSSGRETEPAQTQKVSSPEVMGLS